MLIKIIGSIIELPMNITDTKSSAFAHVAIKRKGAVHVTRSIKDTQHNPEYVRLLLKAKIELYIYEYLKYTETDKLKEIISNYKYQLDILNTKLYHNECRQNFFHCLY